LPPGPGEHLGLKEHKQQVLQPNVTLYNYEISSLTPMTVNNAITSRNAFSTRKILYRNPYSIFICSLPPPIARYPEAGMAAALQLRRGAE
jgi:hypothetical protein